MLFLNCIYYKNNTNGARLSAPFVFSISLPTKKDIYIIREMKKLFSFISMGKRALSILGLSLLKNSWRKRGKDIILHFNQNTNYYQ
jgi:hypothetical protein